MLFMLVDCGMVILSFLNDVMKSKVIFMIESLSACIECIGLFENVVSNVYYGNKIFRCKKEGVFRELDKFVYFWVIL